ncbi:MAG: hypothetical protein AVDCRST_MAG19-3573, partial [uncultured Thermomicrobiales bacterium]
CRGCRVLCPTGNRLGEAAGLGARQSTRPAWSRPPPRRSGCCPPTGSRSWSGTVR